MLNKWRTHTNKYKTIKSLVAGKLYTTQDLLIVNQEHKTWKMGVEPREIPIDSCIMLIDLKQDPNYVNYTIVNVLYNNKIIPVIIRNKELNQLFKPL